MTTPPGAAHWKATIAGTLRYACREHTEDLRLAAFVAVTDIEHAREHVPQSVPPSERDRAGVWCEFCSSDPK